MIEKAVFRRSYLFAGLTLGFCLLVAGLSSACASLNSAHSMSGDESSVAVQHTRPPRMSVRWRVPVSPANFWEVNRREYAAPLYVPASDDLIVATTNGSVARYNAHNGKEVWYISLGEQVHAQPHSMQGTAFVGTLEGNLYALNMANGEVRWVQRTRGGIETTPAASNGRLFVTDTEDILYALDATTGKILWQYQRQSPEYFTVKGGGTPVVDGEIVYSGFADGALAALFVDSGEVHWTADLSAGKTELIDVDLPVIVTESTVYGASFAGGLYALDKTDGLIQWHVPAESIADFKRRGATIFWLSSSGRIQAVDLRSGDSIWNQQMQPDVPVQLSVWRQFLFVSTVTGPLYVLNESNGQPIGKWEPSSGFNSPVTFGNERGYILSDGGVLYGFKLAY